MKSRRIYRKLGIGRSARCLISSRAAQWFVDPGGFVDRRIARREVRRLRRLGVKTRFHTKEVEQWRGYVLTDNAREFLLNEWKAKRAARCTEGPR